MIKMVGDQNKAIEMNYLNEINDIVEAIETDCNGDVNPTQHKVVAVYRTLLMVWSHLMTMLTVIKDLVTECFGRSCDVVKGL